MHSQASTLRTVRVALAAAVVATAAVALSACSGGEAAKPSPAVSVSSSPLAELTGSNPDALGGDLTLKLGAVLPLTGPQNYYGRGPLRAVELAIAQVRAAGGPQFELITKDHKSGDAQAAVQATRELGQDRVPMAIYSFAAVNGAALPGIEQYKILSLDGIGGTGSFGQGKPWFYGTRSLVPEDTYAGVAEYLTTSYPDVKKVASVLTDYGPEVVDGQVGAMEDALSDAGIEVISRDIAPAGTTDFSAIISKINASDADAVITVQFGADPGAFYKQYRDSGADELVIGSDINSDMIANAGAALEGWEFASEYFDPSVARNPLGEYFVESYEDAYPDAGPPDSYAAGAYEDVLVFWLLVQRVIAAGGDPSDSQQLLDALEADPVFPTVYGNGETGTFSINLDTHTVDSRFLGLYSYDGSKVVPIASYNIGGRDFTLQ
ncbi:ABC transporter substrate-binding protein [Microbacterium sp. CPCC 204701]|uniref:ABC transporter substrate-binding protein n=1 Tax=Microbacterium sp. CPCC 204701 TaxID=2493084 RepID=UPI000FD7F6C5|nr:ABC transporter substrate-binding protein [Microbacterium sp. CPCC 204701]